MRNLLVAQSGGPTAAINATVAGVVSCAVLSGKVDHIYGAVNGIEGVLAEKFLDLGKKLDSGIYKLYHFCIIRQLSVRKQKAASDLISDLNNIRQNVLLF